MGIFRSAACFFWCFLALAGTAAASSISSEAVAWRTLEEGLALARPTVTFLPAPRSGANPENADAVPQGSLPAPPPGLMTVTATVVCIDPKQFSFSLYMASESGSKNLMEIGESEGFAAAINAGMFLPDGLTSTGFLRSATHTNNARIAGNFGAFFVAEPNDAKLPRARLLDKNTEDWQTALNAYSIVMQNYRMTTPGGTIIWKQAERSHSIAALGQDRDGNILFILCSNPVPAADFMRALLRLPLGLGSVMYLEGGSEAALLVNAGDVKIVESGPHVRKLWGAGLSLPNVLGVKRRVRAPGKTHDSALP